METLASATDSDPDDRAATPYFLQACAEFDAVIAQEWELRHPGRALPASA